MKSFPLVASFVLCWFALASAGYGQATVTTKNPESVTETTAKLKGEVNAQGVSQTVTFEIGLSTDAAGVYSLTAPQASPNSATGTATTVISGDMTTLSPGTSYKYRINATPTGGGTTVNGLDVTFSTRTATISAQTATPQIVTATLGATVTPSAGSGPVTSIGFQYGVSTSYGTTVDASPNKTGDTGTAAATVSGTATGLSASTQYHFRAIGTDSTGGQVVGPDATFTTKATDGSGGSGTGGGSVSQGGGAGVLVYNLNFKHLAGFGIDFFEDGYVIVPATGGDGEVIFLGRENGQRKYSRQTGVKFFIAKTRKDRYSVVTMSGTTGATVSMQAYGKADDKIKAEGSDFTITVRASKVMNGLAQAARDETALTSTTTDGVFGFVEFAEMKLNLDEKETDRANNDALTVTNKALELENKVKQRGYSALTTSTTDTSTDADTNQ